MKFKSPKKELSAIEEKSGVQSHHKSRQSIIEMRRNSMQNSPSNVIEVVL